MRVVVSPGAIEAAGVTGLARQLAGGGSVPPIELPAWGVRDLGRRLSAAEVHSLRKALLGLGPGKELVPRDPDDQVVGYVCVGRSVFDHAGGRAGAGTLRGSATPTPVVAVTDHANLTWQSPLRGPNDDSLGPRFTVTAGMYAPELVSSRITAVQGEVAGVYDTRSLSGFETRICAQSGFPAVSSELVPVALIAAHLGFRLAAAVLLLDEMIDEGGRPQGDATTGG
ncbi:MAG: hypothetical protein KKA32_16190 [Actinobacteria bacterium]|nr:hypothetical protein [Actinomycetota bacterium]